MSHYLVRATIHAQLPTPGSVEHEALISEKSLGQAQFGDVGLLEQTLKMKILHSYRQRVCYDIPLDALPIQERLARRKTLLETELGVSDLSYRLVSEYDQWLPTADIADDQLCLPDTVQLAKWEARCQRLAVTLLNAKSGSMAGAREVLIQLVENGPTFCGEIVSKSGRDELYEMGLACMVIYNQDSGYSVATDLGGGVYRRMYGHTLTIAEAIQNRRRDVHKTDDQRSNL